MIAVANDNVIPAREFWNAKVNKIIQDFDYNKISVGELVEQLVNMGYEREKVWALISEDEDY